MASAVVLSRALFAEEVRPDPRRYGSSPPPADLLPDEKKYVEWVNSHVSWLMNDARTRWRRSRAVLLVSGLSVLVIPVMLAVDAPVWVPAVLAFVSAAGHYLQAISRDQELSLIGHEQASRMEAAQRALSYGPDRADARRRDRFKDFFDTVEGIKAEYGRRTFQIRGKEPPKISHGELVV